MRKYPAGGAAIGAMQMVDAAILFANKGQVSAISLNLAAIEFVWALVSLVVAIRVTHRPTRLLAAVFFLYNVSGWLLSFFAIPQTEPVTIPMWFVVVGGLFGAAYGSGALHVAREP